MGRQIDHDAVREILVEEFEHAEENFRKGEAPPVPAEVASATEQLFSSSTQAFREALVGCVLARIIDPEINIRLPYMNQGDDAFNGRTLDEKVVNPFLHERSIPCSKSPYLNVIRRDFRFMPEKAAGVRDKAAFSSLLTFIGQLQNADPDSVRS
jgi:hypothetical protein